MIFIKKKVAFKQKALQGKLLFTKSDFYKEKSWPIVLQKNCYLEKRFFQLAMICTERFVHFDYVCKT